MPGCTPVVTRGLYKHNAYHTEATLATTQPQNSAVFCPLITKLCFFWSENGLSVHACPFGAPPAGRGGKTSCAYAEQGEASSCARRQPQDSGGLHVSATTHFPPFDIQVTISSGPSGWVSVRSKRIVVLSNVGNRCPCETPRNSLPVGTKKQQETEYDLLML